LPVNALVEMVFEMPEEISGQKNRNVLCQGRVIRCSEQLGAEAQDQDQNQDQIQETENGDRLLAASIVDYKFIR
jgi:hypothetical protein